jgi:hypothetical protein
MGLCALDPPALPRQPIRLTNDEDGEFRLTKRGSLIVDDAKHFAKLPHLGSGEMMAEQLQHFGIADRRACPGRGNKDRANLRRIG